MSTNTAALEHIESIRNAANAAMSNINRYRSFNGDMTNAAKTALLATVTTVPAELQHASNCAICNGWDGSTS